MTGPVVWQQIDVLALDVARIDRDMLGGLSADGRPCEACGGRIHEHAWADLDGNGFAVACSEQPTTP